MNPKTVMISVFNLKDGDAESTTTTTNVGGAINYTHHGLYPPLGLSTRRLPNPREEKNDGNTDQRPTKRARTSYETCVPANNSESRRNTTPSTTTTTTTVATTIIRNTKPRKKPDPSVANLNKRLRQLCTKPPAFEPSSLFNITGNPLVDFTQSGTWDDIICRIVNAGFSSMTHPWTYRTLLNLSATCKKFLHYTERFWWNSVRTSISDKRGGNVFQHPTDKCLPFLVGNTSSLNPCTPLRFRREWLREPHLYCTRCRTLALDCSDPKTHSKVRSIFHENKNELWWWNREDAMITESFPPNAPFLRVFPLLHLYESSKPLTPIKIQSYWRRPPPPPPPPSEIKPARPLEEYKLELEQMMKERRLRREKRGIPPRLKYPKIKIDGHDDDHDEIYSSLYDSEAEDAEEEEDIYEKHLEMQRQELQKNKLDHLISSRSLFYEKPSKGVVVVREEKENTRLVEANVYWIWIALRS